MRGAWVAVVVGALSIGAASHAGEPPAAPPDLAGEIAWARATWPDVFADVHFETPLARLLAWAPPRGERVAYLYTEEHACREVGLHRENPDTLDSCYYFASGLTHRGKTEEAKEFARRAAEGARKVLGPGHPSTRKYEKLLADLEAKH